LAWYQRTYFNLNIFLNLKKFAKIFFNLNFIILLFVIILYLVIFYLFSFLLINEHAFCKPCHKSILEKINIGNHFVRVHKNVTPDTCKNIILNFKTYNYDYKKLMICKFLDCDGLSFSKNNPFSHPHLLFDGIKGFDDYFVTIQMSTKNIYCESIITNHTVYGVLQNQYACNNFNIYNRSNFIQSNLDTIKVRQYFDSFLPEIIDYFDNTIRRY
jgi:hypothetical protein